MHLIVAAIFCSLLLAPLGTNAHASAPSGGTKASKTGEGSEKGVVEPAAPARKKVSIHLESYADAKSRHAANEIAALLEERLARRPGSQRALAAGSAAREPAAGKSAGR